MQVFKSTLKIFFKHPIYIVIYIFFLSFMGIFIGMSSTSAPKSAFAEERPTMAIIDRDGSEFSQGLTEFMESRGSLVEIEDTRLDLQDATAKNRAAYIMIIPKNFGEDFMRAARQASAIPTLETLVSYESIGGNMMNGLVNEYLNKASLYASTALPASQAEVVSLTKNDMAHEATATMLQLTQSGSVSPQWILYMLFIGYTIMLSIIVCVGVVLSAFNRTEIRRRDLSSPLSPLSMNLQIAAACFIIVLLIWLWACALGLIVFGSDLVSIDVTVIGSAFLSLLVFCGVSLAIGFLLGQLTVGEGTTNAVGNITGIVCSFLGGLWVPLEFMGEGLSTLSRFIPTYYYAEAIAHSTGLSDFSPASLVPILENIGIMLLFAVAVFAIALVAGRLRRQSAEAGGNAAAERVRI